MDKKRDRVILLEDGSVFYGSSFGAASERKLELVFNTSMVGYTEILSDPSYTGQGVVMTYPLMGNYGACKEDYETTTPTISGMIVRECCDIPSNFRMEQDLQSMMRAYDIVGVQGVDTRRLARHIRDYGSCKAYIITADHEKEAALKELRSWELPSDMVKRVSTKTQYVYNQKTAGTYHVVAIDCGMKKNILRMMDQRNMKVTVVPWNTSAREIGELHPDGVFTSNGPGDPVSVPETIATIRELLGNYPIFGICLGHQLLALAYGAETYKLKFGHRGGNHPVQYQALDRIEITSQNHSFAVKEGSLAGSRLKVTHRNLLDQTIEGISCEEDLAFSVQYHPESAPGPQDSTYLFEIFEANMKKFKERC